jgi:hypothetical protein
VPQCAAMRFHPWRTCAIDPMFRRSGYHFVDKKIG